MGAVPMEDIEWRNQLVMLEVNGRQVFNVYEVGVNKNTQDVVYVSDPEPICLSGDSVDEIMSILHRVHTDIRKYGVLSQRRVEDSVRASEVDSPPSVDEDDTTQNASEYTDNDMVELMDQDYDEGGNVLDLVEFMERNK